MWNRVTSGLVALSLAGCVSVFADSGSGWRPEDGAPTCRPSTAFVADMVLFAGGIVGAIAGAVSCGDEDDLRTAFCSGIRATPGLAVSLGGATGMFVGGLKMSACKRTHRRWAELRATVDDTIARETGTHVMQLGDTLVLVATSPGVCNDTRWFTRVRAHRAVLVERGLVRASCRFGEVEVAGGQLDR